MLEVHISKHSLFRLKITVGCLVSGVVCCVLCVHVACVVCGLCVCTCGVVCCGVMWCVWFR